MTEPRNALVEGLFARHRTALLAFFFRRPRTKADEFNRYGRIVIEIDDQDLRAMPISGVFDAYDTDSFAAFLHAGWSRRAENSDADPRPQAYARQPGAPARPVTTCNASANARVPGGGERCQG